MSGSIRLTDIYGVTLGKAVVFPFNAPRTAVIKYVAHLVERYYSQEKSALLVNLPGSPDYPLVLNFRGLSIEDTPQLNFELFKLLARYGFEDIVLEDNQFSVVKLLTLCPAQMVADHYKNFDNLIAYLKPITHIKNVLPDIILFSVERLLPEYMRLKVQIDQFYNWESEAESLEIIATIKCPLDGKKFLLYSYLRSLVYPSHSKYFDPTTTVQSIIDILVKARDDAIEIADFVAPDLSVFDKVVNENTCKSYAARAARMKVIAKALDVAQAETVAVVIAATEAAATEATTDVD